MERPRPSLLATRRGPGMRPVVRPAAAIPATIWTMKTITKRTGVMVPTRARARATYKHRECPRTTPGLDAQNVQEQRGSERIETERRTAGLNIPPEIR